MGRVPWIVGLIVLALGSGGCIVIVGEEAKRPGGPEVCGPPDGTTCEIEAITRWPLIRIDIAGSEELLSARN